MLPHIQSKFREAPTEIGEFPKNIGDIVLCMGGKIPGIPTGNRYVVIHTPDIELRSTILKGNYWVMTESDFDKCNILRGDVPIYPVGPTDLESADNFAWVGKIYMMPGIGDSQTRPNREMYP